MFSPVEGQVSFPKLEEEVLRFWKERRVYHRSLDQRAGAEPFVFFEGPPTANGMPHPGHCLTRTIKDVFPRYKTMRGYRCERKAGWDTHGLPVEVEVCKELTKELGRPVHSKDDIESFGVEPFIQRCQRSVWRYMQEWERLTERLGFWVDLDEAYVTYHQSYVESVWWSLKELFDRGLLYQGHKIVWWWAQGGTALSAGEVGQGYRQVADPSVYVKFPLVGDELPKELKGSSLLVWTTTPWTLPSNQFAAVHPDIVYKLVRVISTDGSPEEKLLLAEDLIKVIEAKRKVELKEMGTYLGSNLIGYQYFPPFDCYYGSGDGGSLVAGRLMVSGQHELQDVLGVPVNRYMAGALLYQTLGVRKEDIDRVDSKGKQQKCWRVVPASFVTTESGTGIVHQAPAFGEVDYDVLVGESLRFLPGEGPTLINCVGPDGKFTDEAPEFVRGRWVKDCDKDINRDLKERGLLFHQEQYLHDYPFCWRAEEDPLIQYPRESWFIKTTAFKDAMLDNNRAVNWLPGHIKDGRMGKFLESNVDWALSRERYWGTPLPIWQCEATGKQEAIGGYDDLLSKPGVAGTDVWERAKAADPTLPDDLRVHKPYIDAVTYESPYAEGARMKRVPEVIDCWYDSGAMPFAQWGYKGEALHSPPPQGEGQGGGEAGTRGAPTPALPQGGREQSAADRFRSQFPADFISEALDQTRGWFYSQLAISTMLFGEGPGVRGQGPEKIPRPSSPVPHPFRNCIVLGLMLGEDGQKMSKSKRNYRDPAEIFDLYGADALRWYLLTNQPPWSSIRYSEQAIKDSIPEFLLRLWNCYSFFVIYANIDGFDPTEEVGSEPSEGSGQSAVGRKSPPPPGEGQGGGEPGSRLAPTLPKVRVTEGSAGTQDAPSPNPSPVPEEGDSALTASRFAKAKSYRPVAERDELDRWVLSELHRTIALVTERMDAYDNFGAGQAITEFVDGLSNWYVRRCRDRFWAAEKRSTDKLDAYWTLYECLVETAKLIAPFTPFLAEAMWRNLAGPFGEAAPESVHLCAYPASDAGLVDEALSERMGLVRLIASLGLRARQEASLKVRQPLAKVEVILADKAHQAWLAEHAGVIAGELNVKAVEFADRADQYVDYAVLPNFKLLGKKLGGLMPKLKAALGAADGAALLSELSASGKIALAVEGQPVELTSEEIEVRLAAKPGWAAASDRGVVVVLATELTDELIQEGMARDLIRTIQDRRKEIGCEFTDRIHLRLSTESSLLEAAFRRFGVYIAAETLAIMNDPVELTASDAVDITVADATAKLYVRIKK